MLSPRFTNGKVMKKIHFFFVDVVVCLNGSDDDDVHNHFFLEYFPNILFIMSFGENLGCPWQNFPSK